MVVGHGKQDTYDRIEEAKRKYFRSEKGKAAFRRYYDSEKGQMRRRRLKMLDLLAKECSTFLQDNPDKTVEDFLNQIQGGNNVRKIL